MVVFDARPSAFTQLTTTAEWEYLWSASGGVSAVDASYLNAFSTGFDIPGRNLILNPGSACVRGQLWRSDAAVNVAIPAASAQDRIDRIVLRYNRSAVTAATVIVPTIITGTPSGSPTMPALVQTPTGIWDFPIAYWTSQSTGGLTGRTDDRDRIVNDIWHSVTPPGGWLGGVNYKMHDDYTVELAGQIVLPSTGSYNGVTLATLPPIYQPMGLKSLPMVSHAQSAAYGNNSGAPGAPPYVEVDVTGTVKLRALPASINAQTVNIDGVRYPLDF